MIAPKPIATAVTAARGRICGGRSAVVIPDLLVGEPTPW